MNNNKTDNELYDIFMKELEDGEKEYDRLMASGEAPARKVVQMRRTTHGWWAAAACALFVAGVYGYLSLNDDGGINDENAMTASVNTQKAEDTTTVAAKENNEGWEDAVVSVASQKSEDGKAVKVARRDEKPTAVGDDKDVVASVMLDELVFEPSAEVHIAENDHSLEMRRKNVVATFIGGDRIVDDGTNTYYICEDCGNGSLRMNDVYIDSSHASM